MAKNEVFRNANHLGLTVNAAVLAGDVVVLGAIVGIAQTDYSARDAKATIWFDGAHEIPVANGTYTVGQPIYAHGAGGIAPTDGTKSVLNDGTATTGVLIGHSIEAKTTTGGTGVLRVRLAA